MSIRHSVLFELLFYTSFLLLLNFYFFFSSDFFTSILIFSRLPLFSFFPSTNFNIYRILFLSSPNNTRSSAHSYLFSFHYDSLYLMPFSSSLFISDVKMLYSIEFSILASLFCLNLFCLYSHIVLPL